nr:unnamed protein product [Callosobruchus analis]
MSNMQVAKNESGAVCVGKREEEEELTEETTLTESHKDLGHTKIHEKTAEFESEEKKSLVEENRTQQSQSTRSVVQSEKTEVSQNRKVMSSSFQTSQSYSMEETEEYEIEG